MAPGASTNQGIREFYAPRSTGPSTTSQQRSMPRVEHQSIQRPKKPLASHTTKHTRPDENHQTEAGFLAEIKQYKAGDEFVLLWKWVDNFMDKRRAKNSSKSHTVNQSTSRQTKPTSSSTRVGGQAQRPDVTPSPETVRRQATDREVMREYKVQRQTPWGELLYLYQSWKDQQAKKKADRATQRKAEEIARSHPSASAQAAQLDVAGNPKPVNNKKRGEVLKHTVKITQLPPLHNSIHLQHTPSQNYGTGPSHDRGQKNRSTRDTRFSDFVHLPTAPPSRKPAPARETQWAYAVPGQDDEFVRNSNFSSRLDPAKEKKAKEAQKAKIPTCYICGSSDCAGGYRDIISRLWVCELCQKNEGIEPVQCAICGQPSSPNSGYAAGNGLWMCSSCRDPTTPKELPPTPKLARKGTSKSKTSRPPIPISEYNSDHLYSDDGWEPRTTTPPSQKPIGLGNTCQDSEEEEEEEEGGEEDFPPPPPLKDRKYYLDSPTLPAIDYNQSYLRQPGARSHPYAPSSPAQPQPSSTKTAKTITRKPSILFSTQDLPKAKPSSDKKHHNKRPQHPPPFNPTTYPYPSPPNTPPLHKPRPASSVYPTDEQQQPITTAFPYPPPPIPQRFVNRPQRASSVEPGMLSKAALARPMASPRSLSSFVSVEGGRNRRSSWYDFWKPVFETRSP